MAANNPSFQHGRPYEMDDASMPKVFGSKPWKLFRTVREPRIGILELKRNPITTEDLFHNVKASLPRTL